MSSAKCPNCGRANFSSAVVCRHCQCPLVGEFAQAIRASRPQSTKLSYRWLLNATLFSIAFGVLLFLGFFLFTVIPNAMYSSETGWTDYTSEQRSNMIFWYLISLGCGVALISLLFYLRKQKYDLKA